MRRDAHEQKEKTPRPCGNAMTWSPSNSGCQGRGLVPGQPSKRASRNDPPTGRSIVGWSGDRVTCRATDLTFSVGCCCERGRRSKGWPAGTTSGCRGAEGWVARPPRRIPVHNRDRLAVNLRTRRLRGHLDDPRRAPRHAAPEVRRRGERRLTERPAARSARAGLLGGEGSTRQRDQEPVKSQCRARHPFQQCRTRSGRDRPVDRRPRRRCDRRAGLREQPGEDHSGRRRGHVKASTAQSCRKTIPASGLGVSAELDGPDLRCSTFRAQLLPIPAFASSSCSRS